MNTASIAGLSPKAKPTAEIIARACERYGFGCQFGTANKHPYAEITVNRQTRKIYFSSTPSDYRSRLNTISILKKTARSLGWEPSADNNEDEDIDMTHTVKSLAELPRLGDAPAPGLPPNWIGKPVRGRITNLELLKAYEKRNEWIVARNEAGAKSTEIWQELRRAGWDLAGPSAIEMVLYKARGGTYPSQVKRGDVRPSTAPEKIEQAKQVQAAPENAEGLDPLILAIAHVIAPLIRAQLAQQGKQLEAFKAKADKWDAIAGLVRDDA
jgi:hypothetical protein